MSDAVPSELSQIPRVYFRQCFCDGSQKSAQQSTVIRCHFCGSMTHIKNNMDDQWQRQHQNWGGAKGGKKNCKGENVHRFPIFVLKMSYLGQFSHIWNHLGVNWGPRKYGGEQMSPMMLPLWMTGSDDIGQVHSMCDLMFRSMCLLLYISNV